jgi:hypothetical protein
MVMVVVMAMAMMVAMSRASGLQKEEGRSAIAKP